MRKLLATIMLSSSLCMSVATAAITTTSQADTSSFVIKKIQIDGLQRISKGTVYTYLPVKVGDQLTTAESNKIIEALYGTDFFSNVALSREGNTLIIDVKELPVIGAIHISGNKDIPTKKLVSVLKSQGFSEGNVYNRSLAKQIKQSLQDQYYARGKYNARVTVTIDKELRNRVGVNIKVSEGLVATIRNINIVGDHVFKESELLDQLTISTPGWLTWFSGTDQYSSAKMQASLAALTSYYMDRGYIEFKVNSVQIAITPNRKSVYITVNVTEGPKFYFKGYQLTGNLILPRKQMQKLVTIKKGDVFSRQAVIASDKAMSKTLGDVGYAFATIEATPKIDKKSKTVFLTLKVVPNGKYYVNQIHFYGNNSVNDMVLRRSMRQMEGGVWNTKNVEQSKWQLQQLPYLKSVQMSTERVPGAKNKVNINYKIAEKNSANFTASIGYSQLDGIILSAGVMEHDFLGTGKTVGFNLQRSRGYQSYSLNYVNPYYTLSGISRSINLYLTKVDPGEINLTNSYSISQTGFNVNYTIPISESLYRENDISLGYGLENTILDVGNGPPEQVSTFVNKHGRHFLQANLTAGWVSNGFDKIIFPTEGFTQSVSGMLAAPLTRKSIGYYTVGYKAQWYRPITRNHHFILNVKGEGNYGNSYMRSAQMPFFSNFYSGGIDSVRGYEGNTLGPKDSQNNPIGGNLSVLGSVGLIFPSPIEPNSLRTTAFVDAGNVFNAYGKPIGPGFNKLNRLRYSAGLELDWLTPLGTINISFAKALNSKHGDDTEPFQFSIGKSF